MRVLFINLSLRPGAKRRLLPVGLAYVMTAVKKAGFDFDLIDMDIDELSLKDLEKLLVHTKYDVYAFGCIVTGFKIVRGTAEVIKRINPESVIIAGNSVATSIPEILLKNTKVDIAVLGEGDVTTVELLKELARNKDYRTVKGIAFRENGRVCFTSERPVESELDPFCYPDWEIFDLDKYSKYAHVNCNAFFSKSAIAYPLNTGRGCPYSCTFCYHVFKGKKYRRYSESAIVEEIKRLHHKFGASYIMFWDELTFPHIKAVKALVDKIGEIDFKIGWDAPCRAGLFKKEHLNLIRDMKAVGCENMAFSLENASPEILTAMNKKITVEQFIEQAETLWKGGVPPRTSVIFGYPQETPETIKKTLDLCNECNIFPSVGFLLPLPKTPIYEWARKNGYIDDEVAYLERIGDRQDFHINLTQMSDEEFVDTVSTHLNELAVKEGLELESVFKTGSYKKPKREFSVEDSEVVPEIEEYNTPKPETLPKETALAV